MKPISIILIGINLFFVVICGIAFAAMLAKGNHIIAAIDLIAVLLNVFSIVMLISEK